jgi:hypothetical protein
MTDDKKPLPFDASLYKRSAEYRRIVDQIHTDTCNEAGQRNNPAQVEQSDNSGPNEYACTIIQKHIQAYDKSKFRAYDLEAFAKRVREALPLVQKLKYPDSRAILLQLRGTTYVIDEVVLETAAKLLKLTPPELSVIEQLNDNAKLEERKSHGSKRS